MSWLREPRRSRVSGTDHVSICDSENPHSRSKTVFRPRVRTEELQAMENDSSKDQFSRRGFLGAGSAALAAVAGTLVLSSATAQEVRDVKIDLSSCRSPLPVTP